MSDPNNPFGWTNPTQPEQSEPAPLVIWEDQHLGDISSGLFGRLFILLLIVAPILVRLGLVDRGEKSLPGLSTSKRALPPASRAWSSNRSRSWSNPRGV